MQMPRKNMKNVPKPDMSAQNVHPASAVQGSAVLTSANAR